MSTSFYQANPLLKSARVAVEYTDEQLDEYIKCKTDVIYFIKTYCKIVSLDSGLVDFNLYQYQENFIRTVHENRMVISMQPRQSGKTQTIAAYITWYLLFNSDKTVAILANKAAAAREIMSRIQLMIEHTPKWLQQGIVEWNKGSIAFENNSKAFTAATSSSACRGKSVNLLYIDEVSSISNNVANDFFTSTYPVISSGKSSKIILTSTPIGLNHFWKFWTEAENKINDFVPFRVNYWEHPDRNQEWADTQRKLLGEVKYNQEICCKFLGSANTLINTDTIQQMPVKRPIFSKDGLDVYYRPEPNHIYILIADTAKGIGQDYSAFQLIDITKAPYLVVAKYRDNLISPILYPNIIHRIAKEYNDAFVLIEINSSEQVAHILYSDLEYENIMMVDMGKRGQQLSSGFGSASKRLGIHMDKRVKRIGCQSIKALIENNQLIIHDSDTLSEFNTFVERRGSFAADEGEHDDLVMPLIIFGWVVTNESFKHMTDVNLREAMFKSRMESIEADLLPVGFYSDGSPESIDGWITVH